MSFEELEEHDIFLPEDVWGKLDLSTSVNQWALGGSFVVGLVASALMLLGGGKMWTWVGMGLFFVFMFYFTWVSAKGIETQHRRVEEAKEKFHEEDETQSG